MKDFKIFKDVNEVKAYLRGRREEIKPIPVKKEEKRANKRKKVQTD